MTALAGHDLRRERAWGRRLAKRFQCDKHYDDQLFTVVAQGTREWVVDVAPSLNGNAPKMAGDLFDGIDADEGGSLIAFAWAFAEDLAARVSS